MEIYITGLALGILGIVLGRKIMADTSKLQASIDSLTKDLSAKFAAVQKQLDGLNAANDPAEQTKIDAISAQVDAADQAVKNFDPSATLQP